MKYIVRVQDIIVMRVVGKNHEDALNEAKEIGRRLGMNKNALENITVTVDPKP